MLTLTYGRKKPQNQDKGSVFWDALADNVVLDDAHDHDGSDSPKIQSYNLTRGSVSVLGTGWTGNSDGTYKKSVTMPGSHTWGNCKISVFLSGGADDGFEIYPTLVTTSSTTFEIWLLTDTQALTVLFT